MDEKKIARKIFLKKVYKVVGIIVDMIVYPVIIFSMLSSFLMLSSKNKNQVSNILGFSVATVLTSSMVAGGFDVNEIVFLKNAEPTSLRPGDIIAFYRYIDSDDPIRNDLALITDFETEIVPSSLERVVGTKTKQDAAEEKALIIFHRITKVYVAADGTRFFETKGDSNSTADPSLTREEFVVGRYAPIPEWVGNVLGYASSETGMYVVVILPLSILIIIQLFEVMNLIFSILTERKVLAREIRFDSQESLEANVGIDMPDKDKVYFYDISSVEDKEKVKEFLWGHLNLPTSPEKDKLYYDKVTYSIGLYNLDREEYWNFWINEQKTPSKATKLKNLKVLADLIVLAESPAGLQELKAEFIKESAQAQLNSENSKNVEVAQEVNDNIIVESQKSEEKPKVKKPSQQPKKATTVSQKSKTGGSKSSSKNPLQKSNKPKTTTTKKPAGSTSANKKQ